MASRLVVLAALSWAVFSSAAAAAAPVVLEGRLTVVHLDPEPGQAAPYRREYWLAPDQGARQRIEFPEALRGEAARLDRWPVRVSGSFADSSAPNAAFRATSVEAMTPAAPSNTHTFASAAELTPGTPVLGKRPWLNVMCKFADRSDEQKDPSFLTAMFSATRPGLNYYWKELSSSQMSISGTVTTPWHTLPQAYAYYVYDDGSGVPVLDTQRAFDDCTGLADAEVDFRMFSGINLIFNDSLGCCASGGAMTATLDGMSRLYGVTWLPPAAWQVHTAIAHEMGHAFGLAHSRGNNETSRNPWDIMSDAYYNCAANTDPDLGCLGDHTIAYHKHQLGWIPPDAVYRVPSGTTQTIRIQKLERPVPGYYQMARIPIAGSETHYYTVETRRRYSYDLRLPGAAIVIHEVDTSTPEAANVVDGDNDGDPYDAGTRWVPGETFTDGTGIKVAVDSTDNSTGYMVTITRPDDILFADGFESGDTSNWSGAKLDNGDLAITTAAAMAGAYGMAVTVNDNHQVHVTDTSPSSESRYQATFMLDLRGLSMAIGDHFTLLGAYGDSAPVVTLEVRRDKYSIQLRGVAWQDDGSRLGTTWATVLSGMTHVVKLEWHAATPGLRDGQVRLGLDGYLAGNFQQLLNTNLRINRVLLGAVSAVDDGTRGTIYFDAFTSSRP